MESCMSVNDLPWPACRQNGEQQLCLGMSSSPALHKAIILAMPSAGENDVTIILKPFPGAKRWQHLQRQQGPAGGEQFAVEANYTVILGSHRNSKLKIEKNGEEKAVVSN